MSSAESSRALPTNSSSATPSLLSPSAASAAQAQARLRNKVGNHPRQSSGVYNSFSTKQIQGFKEAFSMIDQDGDGLVTRQDLSTMVANLGQTPTPELLDSYMATALDVSASRQGSAAASQVKGINFTQFLTMFGEHLAELDEAPELLEAFECFDERDDGVIDAGEMRYWLSEVGDRMSDREIDRLLSGPFMDRGGRQFDYKAFVEAIRMSEPAEVE